MIIDYIFLADFFNYPYFITKNKNAIRFTEAFFSFFSQSFSIRYVRLNKETKQKIFQLKGGK